MSFLKIPNPVLLQPYPPRSARGQSQYQTLRSGVGTGKRRISDSGQNETDLPFPNFSRSAAIVLEMV
jgi:hypothetical protein